MMLFVELFNQILIFFQLIQSKAVAEVICSCVSLFFNDTACYVFINNAQSSFNHLINFNSLRTRDLT